VNATTAQPRAPDRPRTVVDGYSAECDDGVIVTTTAPIELPEEFLRDPAPVYERLRAQGPVHHVRLPSGLAGWLVTDYTVVKQVLADPAIRKDVRQIRRIIDTTQTGVHAMGSDMAEPMLNTDPPEHTRLRKLVAKAFTPGRWPRWCRGSSR